MVCCVTLCYGGYYETKLTAAGGGTGYASFGRNVAVDGNTIVAGAMYNYYGRIYVFQYDESARHWEEVATLFADNKQAPNRHGMSVVIDGEIIVGGTTGAIIGGDYGNAYAAAYIFQPAENNQWMQTTKFDPPPGEPLGLFGRSVSVRGDTVVAGDPSQPAVMCTGIGTGSGEIPRKLLPVTEQDHILAILEMPSPLKAAPSLWERQRLLMATALVMSLRMTTECGRKSRS